MDVEEKLTLLGGAARYEVVSERQRLRRPAAGTPHGPRAALCVGEGPAGPTGALLRVLQSSRCEQDCAYCPLRRSNDPRRASFEPAELAGTFADLARRGRVDGLLLSSANDGGPERSMQRMLDTLHLLRGQHAYEGYIHLKVLPGTGQAALEEAARLADRLSLNVEVPEAAYLAGLDTGKRWLEDIVQPLDRLRALDRAGAIRSGISSQLLVGVGGATDRALALGSSRLRHEYGMRRVHFGDFQPAPGTPLAQQAAPDSRRRARLYQWDWLATDYDFAESELEAAFDAAGNLPLNLDPKVALRLARPQERPTEINSASYEDLLRVPGIGPIGARRIVDLRRVGSFTRLEDLRAVGVAADRAAPFVLLNGRRPPEADPALQRLRSRLRRALEPQPVQLPLWPDL